MIKETIPEQDTVSMLRKLTEEEFQLLAANQEKILKDHYAKQVPSIGKLFPSLLKKAHHGKVR